MLGKGTERRQTKQLPTLPPCRRQTTLPAVAAEVLLQAAAEHGVRKVEKPRVPCHRASAASANEAWVLCNIAKAEGPDAHPSK